MPGSKIRWRPTITDVTEAEQICAGDVPIQQKWYKSPGEVVVLTIQPTHPPTEPLSLSLSHHRSRTSLGQCTLPPPPSPSSSTQLRLLLLWPKLQHRAKSNVLTALPMARNAPRAAGEAEVTPRTAPGGDRQCIEPLTVTSSTTAFTLLATPLSALLSRLISSLRASCTLQIVSKESPASHKLYECRPYFNRRNEVIFLVKFQPSQRLQIVCTFIGSRSCARDKEGSQLERGILIPNG
ncbi:hypothetical protein C8R47DRAFT_805474 [Mycena vitilis]|nr:hypothetical protein C8R47DRAFT_805474 [Mycena vitilis]